MHHYVAEIKDISFQVQILKMLYLQRNHNKKQWKVANTFQKSIRKIIYFQRCHTKFKNFVYKMYIIHTLTYLFVAFSHKFEFRIILLVWFRTNCLEIYLLFVKFLSVYIVYIQFFCFKFTFINHSNNTEIRFVTFCLA